ncbi:MAG: hypothetical protein IPJ69_09535 [Deltaproteobacteria bacterium]|nr:MAG: hypothetical protein IPJ69_09535 [Deltaproteobacteria bacterium]
MPVSFNPLARSFSTIQGLQTTVGYLMFLVAGFIAVSVVLVKQSYIGDVVTGYLVAWISYVWEF